MHEKFSRRIETALGRLASRIDHSTKRIDLTQVNRQIGRILQQNQRAATRFDVHLIDGVADVVSTSQSTRHSMSGQRSQKDQLRMRPIWHQ